MSQLEDSLLGDNVRDDDGSELGHSRNDDELLLQMEELM